MKKLAKYIPFCAALALGAAFTGCQDDIDAPQMDVPKATSVPNTTIAELKELFWDDATNYALKIQDESDPGRRYIISGRVISSDEQSNVFKSLVIQDKTAALAFSINSYNLYLNYRVGQEIVLDVTDMYIGKYNGLQQMGMPEWYTQGNCYEVTFMAPEYFSAHAELNGLPDAALIDTISVPNFSVLTPSPEILRKYQSQLVRLKNVYFEEGGKELFSEYHSSGVNRNLVDRNGQTLVVRTSGYSTFWNQLLPTGNIDVVGILSYYGTTGWQFILIDEAGCIKAGDFDPSLGTLEKPYSVKQVVQEEKEGNSGEGWVHGWISGAVAPGVENVTSLSDLELYAPTTLPTTLVIGAEQVRGLDSTLVVFLPADSPLRQYGNLSDNSDNLGKEIWVKGTFETVMGTFGVVTTGSATDFRIEGVEIDTGELPEGDGSETNPYNPAQVIAKNPSSTTDAVESEVWVQGYIVGSMPTGGSSTTLQGTSFGLTDAATTNLVIAPLPDCTDYTKCVGLQLPTGAIRNALNLASNPDNLGKLVAVKGDLMKYCGGPGVKNLTAYKLDAGTTPDPTPAEAVTSLDVNFDASTNLPAGWTDVNVAGNKTWYIATFSGNNYAAMTGYKGTAPFDEWLISPPVDMTNVADKVLTFSTQVNGYGSTTSKFEVYVLTAPNPADGTKTQLNPTIATAPASGYSDWVSSGNIDLSSYSGTIYIGFRYEATTDANYATWCVDNIKLNAGSGDTPTPVDPTPDDPVVGGDGTKESPLAPADVIALDPKSTSEAVATDIWAAGYIVGFYNGSTVKDNASFGVTDAVASNILLAPTADCTDYTKCIPIQLPSGAVRTALNLKDNPGNLGKRVEVNGDVALYGGLPGIRNTKGYEWLEGGTTPVDPTPDDPTPDDPTPAGDAVTVLASVFTTLPGSTTAEGYTFDIQTKDGATAPAYNSGTAAVRLYAKNQLTIKGAKFSKVVVTLSNDAKYRYTTFTPSAGKLDPAQAEGDTTITWVGDATEVTFTVGDKATMGSDGATKAGQIRFSKIEIYPAE